MPKETLPTNRYFNLKPIQDCM